MSSQIDRDPHSVLFASGSLASAGPNNSASYRSDTQDNTTDSYCASLENYQDYQRCKAFVTTVFAQLPHAVIYRSSIAYWSEC